MRCLDIDVRGGGVRSRARTAADAVADRIRARPRAAVVVGRACGARSRAAADVEADQDRARSRAAVVVGRACGARSRAAADVEARPCTAETEGECGARLRATVDGDSCWRTRDADAEGSARLRAAADVEAAPRTGDAEGECGARLRATADGEACRRTRDVDALPPMLKFAVELSAWNQKAVRGHALPSMLKFSGEQMRVLAHPFLRVPEIGCLSALMNAETAYELASRTRKMISGFGYVT